MEIVVSAYGAAAGDAILNYLPYGGYYVTGGLAPKNLEWFTEARGNIFLKACFDKYGAY
jgi:glucokinase